MQRRFDGQPERPVGIPVIRPTGRCTNAKCGNEAFIALAQCETPGGSRTILSGGEAVNSDWTARSGYRLLGWIERCAQCFSSERFREEVSRYREEGRRHPIDFRAHAHIRDRETFQRLMGVDFHDLVKVAA